jgi:uncharacterized protein (TIGR00369 family)
MGPRHDDMSTVTLQSHEDWGTPRSKAVTWYDPATLGAAAAGLSGREFLQAIADGRLPPPPMANLVGARLVWVGDSEVRFACAPDESAYNPLGMVHGGLLCTLLDFAAGAAVHTLLPAGVGFSSIEIKVSYLKALRADSGEIEVHGQALRVGGRVAFAEAHARNGNGELVGHATSSIAVLRPERDKPVDH